MPIINWSNSLFVDVTATILAMGSTQAGEGMFGFPLAINLNANFASSQRTGKLRAVASFVKKGKRTIPTI